MRPRSVTLTFSQAKLSRHGNLKSRGMFRNDYFVQSVHATL